METQTNSRPLLVSTWPFGKATNDRALEVIRSGKSTLDAIEQGIWVTEDDANIISVGKSSSPNADGVVQLDASIMWRPGHQAGSVAGLEGIAHPISVTRRVMAKTEHVMLVGNGAQTFALKQGFPKVELLTDQRRQH